MARAADDRPGRLNEMSPSDLSFLVAAEMPREFLIPLENALNDRKPRRCSDPTEQDRPSSRGTAPEIAQSFPRALFSLLRARRRGTRRSGDTPSQEEIRSRGAAPAGRS